MKSTSEILTTRGLYQFAASHYYVELEGEGGSSVNYLDVTISIRRNRLRWTLYDKKKFIFIDGKALSESPNFPWYDSKLTERSKVGVVTSEMVRYSRRTDTETDFRAQPASQPLRLIAGVLWEIGIRTVQPITLRYLHQRRCIRRPVRISRRNFRKAEDKVRKS